MGLETLWQAAFLWLGSRFEHAYIGGGALANEQKGFAVRKKELIYAAVSIANSCDYCIHSHTAAARSKGMTDEQYAEFLSIVSLAGRTNHLLNGIKVPVDPEFDRS